jgi:hypothetical protein
MSTKKKINKNPVTPICINCVHGLINERERVCTNQTSTNFKKEIYPNSSCNKFEKKLKLR